MKEQILTALRAAGGHLTRNELWEKLPTLNEVQWKVYYKAEQYLIDSHLIEVRRGRNGGVYLVEDINKTSNKSAGAETISEIIDPEFKLESTYYPIVLSTIHEHWASQPGFTNVFGAVTAGQGRRVTGGRWSRPDIVICTISDWLFSSRPEGDVRTIEVKRYEALDVLGVYEALSHKSRAHFAYLLVVNFPDNLTDGQKADFDSVLSVAEEHGIGVITASDAANWKTWVFQVDPLQSNSDNQVINQFLLDQVPEPVRKSFRTAMRTITW